MTLWQRKATLSDLIRVLENPSDITRVEAETAGYTRWTLLKALRIQVAEGEATTVLEGDTPLFVTGHAADPADAANRILWFVATQAWFDRGARGVLYGRRFMAGLHRAYPKSTFTSISWSKHPDLARWFAFQGFALEERAGHASVFRSVG